MGMFYYSSCKKIADDLVRKIIEEKDDMTEN